MKRKFFFMLCCLSAVLIGFHSCNKDEDNTNDNAPYNPGQPVECVDFDPVEGGRATQLMLTGVNLGNDPKLLEVYFYSESTEGIKAPIIGCAHGRALVVVPKLPSTDDYTVRVQIGNQSQTFHEKFKYTQRAVVTTVCGNPISGNTVFREGPFGLCVLRNPRFLTSDIDGNVFVSHDVTSSDGGQLIAMVNEQEEYVRLLSTVGSTVNAPTADATGTLLMFPSNGGNDVRWQDGFFQVDCEAGYSVRERRIFHPSPEEIASGEKHDFSLKLYKHSFAICEADKMIYYRSNQDGKIFRFNPRTFEGEWATTLEEQTVYEYNEEDGEMTEITMRQPMYMLQNVIGDSYLVFDPRPEYAHMLYGTITGGNGSHHIIAWMNIITGENGIYSGGLGKDNEGWRDGSVATAKFNQPRQMVVDNDGNLIIADRYNHCIRMINVRTGMVSTLVGIAGKKGYQDGNPDDALFNGPMGLCIIRSGENEGAIYIADTDNKCIRKLVFE